jgi:hypothetical protein
MQFSPEDRKKLPAMASNLRGLVWLHDHRIAELQKAIRHARTACQSADEQELDLMRQRAQRKLLKRMLRLVARQVPVPTMVRVNSRLQ